MQSLKTEKGMTFLEILIAMTIMGAILFAFISTFGYSYTNIFSQGIKTRAVAEAQALIDFVQNRDAFNGDGTFKESLKTDISAAFPNATYVSVYANVETMSYSGTDIVYSTTSKIIGSIGIYEVTVRVFYQEGSHSVILKALMPATKI